MKALINTCIKHDRATLLVLVIILIIGVYSYATIPKEMTPDVQVPIISVSTDLYGISPQDSESLLVRPIESVMSSVEGLKKISSTATEGMGVTLLEFDAGFDSKRALEYVRAKVDDIIADLPKDASRPIVEEMNLSLLPVINIALLGEIPERELINIARQLEKKIEALPNVLSVDIAGLRKETVDVIVEPRIMDRYNLKLDEVMQSIDSNNKLVAAGKMKNGYSVKVSGVLQDVQDIANVPIKVNDNSTITIKDVAEIRPTFEDRNSYARMNGKSAVVIEVSKRIGKNLIETVEQVKGVVTQAKHLMPENLEIIYSLDQSKQIMDSLRDLENNILMAIMLVLAVIVTFMGYRSAIMVALAIPGSFYIGIVILTYLGMTINIVVLFSLIMSVGMLVDAAVVVNEYADRKMIVGMNKMEAYRISAIRMSWPIVASTATTLIVFVPLLFWPGTIGQFMKYLPITLIATLSGSLLMSLVFIPVIGGIFGAPSTNSQEKITKIQAVEDGDNNYLGPFMRKYYDILNKVLLRPVRFVLIIIGILFASIFAYSIFGKGLKFFPKVEPESAVIIVRSQGNLSIEQKNKLLKQVEDRILNITDEIRIFYSRAGTFSGSKYSSDDVIGTIQLEFIDWQLRRKATDILSEIKDKVDDLKGLIIEIQEEEKGPSGEGKPIAIKVSAFDAVIIPNAVEEIIMIMNKIGGFVNVENSISSPEIEWNITIDRNKAALAGANVMLIGEYIKIITNGAKVGSYRPNNSDEEVDILVRLPEDKRNITQLNSLFVNGANGLVPVSSFIRVEPQNKIKKLDREALLPVFSITADVAPNLLVDDQIKKLEKELRKIRKEKKISDGIMVKFEGETEDQEEAVDFLSKAFAVALMGVILILVMQFNSYYDAFIIMTAVVLSTTGVLIALLMTNNSFVITMCGVGLISLAGIVVNNNILLIDAFKINLEEGFKHKEAILRASISRIKPILLTAGTTVLGLLPMVTKINIDFLGRNILYDAPSSQWWVHLSTTIAGGLLFATVLTLFFTPALLMLSRERKV